MSSSDAFDLVIAPHCDDALLAMGGRILQQPRQFKVVTIFATCAWTARPETYDIRDVSEVNREEERRALKEAGCRLEMFEYPEALLRGYRKWNTKRRHSTDTALETNIRAVIRREAKGARKVYFPMAPGGHVDHQLLHDQIDCIYDELTGQDTEVFVFEDLPYSWYGGTQEQLDILAKRYILEPEIVDCTSEFARKLELLTLYDTQLLPSDLQKVSEYAASLKPGGYGERAWRITKR